MQMHLVDSSPLKVEAMPAEHQKLLLRNRSGLCFDYSHKLTFSLLMEVMHRGKDLAGRAHTEFKALRNNDRRAGFVAGYFWTYTSDLDLRGMCGEQISFGEVYVSIGLCMHPVNSDFLAKGL